MFYLLRVLFTTFLFMGCLNHVPCTIAMTSNTNRLDRNPTSSVEIHNENNTAQPSLDLEIYKKFKVTPNRSSITIPNKRKVRHSRYPKLDNIFNKISKFDETIPTTADEPDVIAINNSRSESRQLLSTSGSDLLDNNYYVSSETSESSSEVTESQSELLYPPLNKDNAAFARERQFEESSIDDDEEEEEEDDDDYGEFEDEVDVPYFFLNQTRLTQDDMDKGYRQYMLALIANGWSLAQKPADIVAEHQPPNSNEDSDWVYGSQADANVDSASGIKWVYYGTRAAIEPSKVPRRNQSANQKVSQHYFQMTKEGTCRVPQRRVVNVQSWYPNPSKTYMPRCTFLHYCGDDTGCCQSDSMTCAPKYIQQVELYFYTSIVGRSGNMIEKLIFTNHTECECVIKGADYMVKDETSAILSLRPGPSMTRLLDTPDANIRTEAPMPLKRCVCPTEFSVHNMRDGDCECDCFNKQKDCLRKKNGREYFSLIDRTCIHNGVCQTPTCKYGDYIDITGRCPRKHEKNSDLPKKIYRK